MRIKFLIPALLLSLSLYAQQDVEKLRETARTFSRQGDYSNAILVLNRAAQIKPNDLEIQKDLAYTQFLAGDLDQAKTLANGLLLRDDADVQTYQIAGNIYKAQGDVKECEKLYRKGLKKFPNSGALHFEFGEILLSKQEAAEAIKEWEEGIDVDPSYSGNYYHAAKYYFYTKTETVWCLLYAEIFTNLESYSIRTAEIKSLLLESYKRFYAETQLEAGGKNQNAFVTAVAATLKKQGDQLSEGIHTESLTMIRTRFLLDWFASPNAEKYPFRLFDQQQYLVREGMFDAYNQWLFGAVDNVVKYQQWTTDNAKKAGDFSYYQKNRVFKVSPGQHYR